MALFLHTERNYEGLFFLASPQYDKGKKTSHSSKGSYMLIFKSNRIAVEKLKSFKTVTSTQVLYAAGEVKREERRTDVNASPVGKQIKLWVKY